MIFQTVADFEQALANLPVSDTHSEDLARARQAVLTKPYGSLGRLEELAVFMAGWQGRAIPKMQAAETVIFAGSHGVTVHGVSAFPDSVNAQMVANFQTGGAAINALCRAADLTLQICTFDLDRPTKDFTTAPAMSEAECLEALSIGAASVRPDLDLFIAGEMGIGNTTIAAAICAQLYGGDIHNWVGAGTGVNAAGLARKTSAIETALALHAGSCTTAFECLRHLGGREVAAMAGAILQARHLRIPVLLDGFIVCSAIAPLAVQNPEFTAHCLAGHVSVEPGHKRLLEHLGLSPILNLNMRLGEGSGAAVAAQILRSAVAAHAEMATFAEAGVTKPA